MASMTLNGLAASPGTYVGRARVIWDIETADSERVEVLVVRTAGVEWLEAILRAGAVVTEVGGRTSHAASVCRELGKPCVTAVTGAMTALADGMTVCVDGGTGEVVILRTP